LNYDTSVPVCTATKSSEICDREQNGVARRWRQNWYGGEPPPLGKSGGYFRRNRQGRGRANYVF
jgi:hypothetical protein